MINRKIYPTVLKTYINFLTRTDKKVPLEVFHKVNFECNLRCKYCGLPENANKIHQMTTNQVKSAISEFADAGTIAWTFSGGEPLLRNDIGQLIDYAKEKGMIVSLNTNGMFFEERLNDVKNIDKIFFSLDGSKEINDKIRGKGNYEKVICAIKVAKNANFDVNVLTLICKENIKNDFSGLKFMFNLAEELKFRILFHPIYIHNYNKEFMSNFLLSDEENIQAINLIMKMKKKSKVIGRPLSLYEDWRKRFRNAKTRKKCYAGRAYCYMLPDGRVAPCLFKENDAINGVKHGFVNAFNKIKINQDCSCTSFFTERNLLYSLNFDSIINLLKR